ncbi:MAG TPA: glycosyltransferase family 2 protein [Sulfuriferula sp.]|nr:glycosyltransferase family 2 protein [Sulfuriferula sp.]
MKFSLVMATLGRSVEIERLFNSLANQTYKHFEVIVVDQNEDDRVVKLVDEFRDRLEFVYLRSEKGLSRARNVGLKHIHGDLVAFPDDDCWYRPDVLEFVVKQFQADPRLQGLTGRSVDGNGIASQGRWSDQRLTVDRYNVWTCATSYTIFLRTEAVIRAGQFNEALGVGSGTRWGAGEEVNFLLRVIQASMYVRYDPDLRIFHPEPLTVMDDKAFSRARLYNRGFGRVLGLSSYPAYFVLYLIFRSMAGGMLSLLRLDYKRARYYWIAASQRFLGWID